MSILGRIFGTDQAARAATAAAETQAGAAEAGIEEQRRQFEAITEMMAPFLEAGVGALGGQQALLGLGGEQAQAEAIQQLQQSPQFQALSQQGEDALLQQASATGGVRGGNIQGALAQFRPQMLSQMIESQYGKLGGLTQLGQSSAAFQAGAGQQTSGNIANLLQQAGAARAGGQLAAGQQQAQNFGNLLSLGAIGASAFGGGGGGAAGSF